MSQSRLQNLSQMLSNSSINTIVYAHMLSAHTDPIIGSENELILSLTKRAYLHVTGTKGINLN